MMKEVGKGRARRLSDWTRVVGSVECWTKWKETEYSTNCETESNDTAGDIIRPKF